MDNLFVVKIGGNIIDDEQALAAFLADFAAINRPKILVHGGGKLATEVSAALGIQAQFVEGRRITDEATLKVVTMVYAGWINKRITAILQANSCKAIGLSGVDANLLPAVKRPVKDVDFGFVGDLLSARVNAGFLNQLLQQGISPVIAPITADATGQLLNVNADTVARTIAQAMCATHTTDLVYCFEKNGLLRNVEDDNSVIESVNASIAAQLKADGIITKGMLPKIDNALASVANGVRNVVIGHGAHIAQIAQQQKGYGTYVTA